MHRKRPKCEDCDFADVYGNLKITCQRYPEWTEQNYDHWCGDFQNARWDSHFTYAQRGSQFRSQEDMMHGHSDSETDMGGVRGESDMRDSGERDE